jgi:hypothetical protein
MGWSTLISSDDEDEVITEVEYKEFENFSHTITYTDPVEEGGPPPTIYHVRIIPQQVNPDSVTIVSDEEQASVSGFFRFTFNDIIQYLAKDRTIKTIDTLAEPPGGAWQKIDLDDVLEMISFKADVTREREFNYIAEAYDSEDPNKETLFTNSYTIFVRDLNWTPGQIALKEAVSYASN